VTNIHHHHHPQGRKEAIMSEQAPENKALNEEPEVEGHKAALNEDPDVFAKAKAFDEPDGPEVEGHAHARAPEDPLKQA
jgi:hypothetical protein